jgi:hypothetical protein
VRFSLQSAIFQTWCFGGGIVLCVPLHLTSDPHATKVREIKKRERNHEFFESRKDEQDNALREIIGFTFRMRRNTKTQCMVSLKPSHCYTILYVDCLLVFRALLNFFTPPQVCVSLYNPYIYICVEEIWIILRELRK